MFLMQVLKAGMFLVSGVTRKRSVIVNVCLYLKSLVRKYFAMRTRESKTTCGN